MWETQVDSRLKCFISKEHTLTNIIHPHLKHYYIIYVYIVYIQTHACMYTHAYGVLSVISNQPFTVLSLYFDCRTNNHLKITNYTFLFVNFNVCDTLELTKQNGEFYRETNSFPPLIIPVNQACYCFQYYISIVCKFYYLLLCETVQNNLS